MHVVYPTYSGILRLHVAGPVTWASGGGAVGRFNFLVDRIRYESGIACGASAQIPVQRLDSECGHALILTSAARCAGYASRSRLKVTADELHGPES